MPVFDITIPNAPRSPMKRRALCGRCGEQVPADWLVKQNGIWVAKYHDCYDNPGYPLDILTKPAAFGQTPGG